jgi:hypothetical protein
VRLDDNPSLVGRRHRQGRQGRRGHPLRASRGGCPPRGVPAAASAPRKRDRLLRWRGAQWLPARADRPGARKGGSPATGAPDRCRARRCALGRRAGWKYKRMSIMMPFAYGIAIFAGNSSISSDQRRDCLDPLVCRVLSGSIPGGAIRSAYVATDLSSRHRCRRH